MADEQGQDEQQGTTAEIVEQSQAIAEVGQTEGVELAEPKKAKCRGGARQGAGRKKLTPSDEDRRQVREMAGCGLTHKQISLIACGGIDPKTLVRYFGHELDIGKAEVIHKIGQCLITDALAGDKTSQLFYLKTQAGWRESNRMELSGPDGEPVTFAAVKWTIVDPPKQE